ncbi:MAG: hypothetical protein MRY63_10640 [Neomegalonema sp.]|nr:hypothetical protein [Neomegalonema sp.]
MARDVATALAARPIMIDAQIPYREEVAHPALLEPAVSRGVMHLEQDGTLIRRQIEPFAETAQITDTQLILLTPSAVGEGQDTRVLEIPPELRPVLRTMRQLIAEDRAPSGVTGALTPGMDGQGWRLGLDAALAENLSLTLLGCGDVLTGIEVLQADGAPRRILFLDETP